jgi:hypothetical protein
MATEYSEVFAKFILECRDGYNDLCAKIDAGDVKAGAAATLKVTLAPEAVDQIRFERIAAAASAN